MAIYWDPIVSRWPVCPAWVNLRCLKNTCRQEIFTAMPVMFKWRYSPDTARTWRIACRVHVCFRSPTIHPERGHCSCFLAIPWGRIHVSYVCTLPHQLARTYDVEIGCGLLREDNTTSFLYKLAPVVTPRLLFQPPSAIPFSPVLCGAPR